ncbi:MAG: hypothetical protein WC081_03215 [Candidatus Ratteibacteria bacterium]|jgi:hypothetical protein
MNAKNVSGREFIGNLLVGRGLLSKKQLDRALEIHEKERELLLGEVMQGIGLIKEEEIVETILLQYNIPYLSPLNYQPNPSALAKVDKEFAEKNYIFPIDIIDNVLMVVSCRPFNDTACEILGDKLNCEVRCFLGCVPDIRKAIKKYYA